MSNSKRIVHVSSSGTSLDGGMSRVSHHWLIAFKQRGWETISFDPTTVKLRGHKSFIDLKLRSAVKPALKAEDVLLVHEPLSGAFVDLGLPLVVFSHGIEERLSKVAKKYSLGIRSWKSMLTFPLWARVRKQTKLGLTKADLILVLNSVDKSFLESGHYRSNNIILYRNGINVSSKKTYHSTNPRLLFVGTWIERKGIKLLREAYHHLRERPNPPRWRFAGTQLSEEHVRNYLDAHNDGLVEIIPSFKGSDEDSVFSECEVLVLPSFMEGQPLALLEGMHRALCCVTTAADGQLDLIEYGKNGFLFPVGESKALIKCLNLVLSDPILREAVGTNARHCTATRSWIAVSSELVQGIEARL